MSLKRVGTGSKLSQLLLAEKVIFSNLWLHRFTYRGYSACRSFCYFNFFAMFPLCQTELS